jgi:DNA polymerase-3 subunit delta'
VEDVDRIEKWVLHPPFESTKKIIVIPKAETINLVAQNKLLKILEEPPEYLFFFLLSPTPDLLLPTIRSRCINVNFQLLPVEFLLQFIEDKFEEAELLDLSIFLLNGSINNIEFYSQDNLQEMIEFVSMVLQRDPANIDLVSDKIDEITKKDFNQLFFVNLVIGILSYALKLKHLNNFQQTSIFNINTLKNIPSMSIIELMSKMTRLASDLRWSNFNFRMGMEEILFDFILDTNLAELKAV